MTKHRIESQITFLYTQDLEITGHFYESVLGLELALDQGTCRIYRVSTDGFIGFCEKSAVRADKADVIFTIVTPDVDQWYRDLVSKGIQFQKPPAVNPKFKIYHFFLHDPNGYLIEIQKFLDPRW